MVQNSCQFLKYILFWCNKVGKDDQILCTHLDPFRWPGHICGHFPSPWLNRVKEWFSCFPASQTLFQVAIATVSFPAMVVQWSKRVRWLNLVWSGYRLRGTNSSGYFYAHIALSSEAPEHYTRDSVHESNYQYHYQLWIV